MSPSYYPSSARIARTFRNPTWPAIFSLILFVVAGYLISHINQKQQALHQPGPSPTALAQGPVPTGSQVLGAQTKATGCVVQNSLPDSACTPGAVFANVTTSQICQSGYSTSVRNVTTATKDKAYAEYAIASHQPGQYEVDHLISLELGGSNDLANLWPEAADPKPGYHEKDQVENYLHDQVCDGSMSLADAQHQIATNWLAVYQTLENRK